MYSVTHVPLPTVTYTFAWLHSAHPMHVFVQGCGCTVLMIIISFIIRSMAKRTDKHRLQGGPKGVSLL